MTIKLLAGFAAFAAVALAACGTGTARSAAPCGADDPGVAALDAHLSALEPYGFGGVVVVRRDGCDLLSKAFGVADADTGRRNTTETAFAVGSITKFYTATAILKLRDRGLIDLDASARDYFDAIPEDKAGVTVRRLLTHRSGLPSDYWDRHAELDEDGYVAMMLARDPDAAPGEQFSYSNFGFHVLKRIVEEVSGEGYERFVRAELLADLGLTNTGLDLPEWTGHDLAFYQDPTAAVWAKRGVDVVNGLNRPIYLRPEGSGGFYATAEDLAVFAEAVFHGEVVDGGFEAYAPREGEGAYGFGLEFRDSPLGLKIGHGGYDDSIGVTARFGFFPATDTTYVILSNTHFSGALTSSSLDWMGYAALSGEELASPPIVEAGAAVAPEVAGVYRGEGGLTITVEARDGELHATASDIFSAAAQMFPGLWSDDARAPDPRATALMAAIAADDRDAFFDLVASGARTDRYFSRVKEGWAMLTGNLGASSGFSQLHTRAYVYDGGREIWWIVGSNHAHGRMPLRVIKDEDGGLYVDVLNVEDVLDQKLTPVGPDRFATWNPHLAAAVEYGFDPEAGVLELANPGGPSIILKRD